MLIDKYKSICGAYSFRNKLVFTDNPSDETAADFIKNYFDSHSKGTLFNLFFTDKESVFSKSIHTVSAFLLGMSFKGLCEANIKNQIRANAPLNTIRFEYPWLLSCLYHDVLSKHEREYGLNYCDSVLRFTETQDITHTIYEMKLPNRINISKYFPIYNAETILKYYEYRISNKSADHGILAGFFAFDRLTKNFIKNWEQNGQKNTFTTNIDGHTLVWDKNQIWIFALVSDAITVHNIWHTNDMTNVSEELIPAPHNKNEVKLSLNKTPLAYYLSLIDTIEPYKYFNGKCYASPEEVFNNISIDLRGEKILITKSQSSEYDFYMWYDNKMKNIGDWLKDTFADCINESEIIIHLPHDT
jgi:hypothetical protein